MLPIPLFSLLLPVQLWSACQVTLPARAFLWSDSVYKAHLAVGHHFSLNSTPNVGYEDGRWTTEDCALRPASAIRQVLFSTSPQKVVVLNPNRDKVGSIPNASQPSITTNCRYSGRMERANPRLPAVANVGICQSGILYANAN